MKNSVSFLALSVLVVSLITIGSQASFAQTATTTMTVSLSPDPNGINGCFMCPDTSFGQGDFVHYIITITNTGSMDATNVIATTNAGAGMIMVPFDGTNPYPFSSSFDGSCSLDTTNQSTCVNPLIPAGTPWQVGLVLQIVDPSKPTTFTVTGDNFSPVNSQSIILGGGASIPNTPVINTPPNGSTTGPLPIISGTADAGNTITIYDGVSTTPIGTTTVQSDGTWSFVPTTPLTLGSHTVTASATDGSGNTSATPNPQTTFTVAVQTISDMKSLVQNLHLDSKTTKTLNDPLDDAQKKLNKKGAVCDEFEEFVHDVKELQKKGKITSDQASILNSGISSLQGIYKCSNDDDHDHNGDEHSHDHHGHGDDHNGHGYDHHGNVLKWKFLGKSHHHS